MKNILLSALGSSILLFTACEKKAEKTEMTVSTTINNEGGQTIKNEVITINEKVNGKSVVLKIQNSSVNSLTIDGQIIDKADYGKYNDLLSPLLKKLSPAPTPPSIDEAQTTEKGENIDKIFESELKKDGFITDGNVKYDFDLSNETLIINAKTQTNVMKERYLNLFKDKTGKELGEKFHIKLQENRMNK